MKTTHERINRLEERLRRAKAKLRELRETVEDLQDRIDLAKAIAQNAGRPGIPWEVIAKELGIRPPAKKRRRKAAR
jgi:hypothetical protein